MQRQKTIGVGAILILIGILFIAYWMWHPVDDHAPKAKVPTVVVTPLHYTVLPLTVHSYGQVVSPTSVNLVAQADGVIASIDFKPEQVVKKGQRLFTLQASDTSAQLQQLKAQADYAKEYYLRDKTLQEKDPGAISEIDVLQASSTYHQALAQYQEAKAIHTIVAPVDGTLSDTSLSVGDFVTTGQVLAILVNAQEQIEYTLPSRYENQVAVGQPITFTTADASQQYSGVVAYVAPLLSNTDYTLTLRANITSKKIPMLNAFGQVTQTLNPAEQVLAVPQNLVKNDAQGFYVYLFKDHQVTKNYFQPGAITESGLILVKSGLLLNAPLITSDSSSLTEHETVQVAS